MRKWEGFKLLHHVRSANFSIAGTPEATERLGSKEARWRLIDSRGIPSETQVTLLMKTVPKVPDKAYFLMFSPHVSDVTDRNIARMCVNADHLERATGEFWERLIHHHDSVMGGAKRNQISEYHPNPAVPQDHVSQAAYYLDLLAYFSDRYGIDHSNVDLEMERWWSG